MTTAVDTLAADIRQVDGKRELGAGALAEALTGLGWTKVVVPTVKPLAAYQVGDLVQVVGKDMAWHDGRVAEMNGLVGSVRVSVDTERGPVSIASTNRIRPKN